MKQRHLGYCVQGVAICLTAHFAIAASTLLFSTPAAAQIVPDATLPVNSIVTPNGNTFTINGGSRAGGNLFHSFQEFSLPTGNEAFFNNAVDVQNIFSRVTGSNISNIDGLIRANGAANLFLLNPNGIIFGPNARLNINGSFVATTANAIGLTNGDIFSASADNQTPTQLLSVNPNALLFNQMTAQAIANRSVAGGTGLQVPAGRSLLLVGGDINLEGGRLQALGGRVELASVQGMATIGLAVDGANLRLTVPAGIPLADASLSNGASVNVSGSPGGSIAVNAQNLNLTAGSRLQTGINSGSGSPGNRAGNIEINVPGAIAVNASSISNSLDAGAAGSSGDINITTGSLSLTNGGRLIASTSGQGNAGSVNIHATHTVSLDGVASNGNASSVLSAVGAPQAVGNAGSINITTGSLFVTNGAALITTTRGRGNGGNVNIRATDTVSFDGFGSNGFPSLVTSGVEAGAIGNGGDINIIARVLSFTNSGGPAARTLGQGKGGNITLTANTLQALNGGQVTTTSFTSGKAGNITVNVADSITLAGSDSTYAQRLATFGRTTVRSGGPASGLYANTSENSTGAGGELQINAGRLIVQDGAQVNVSNRGTGSAGNLTIAADSLRLNNSGSLRAESRAGSQGNITLNVRDIQMRGGSNITTNATGLSEGGNITIDADTLVALENSDITANAVQGRGGNIQISISGIFGSQFRPALTPESDITASSQFGISGNVTITNPEVETRSLLVELPQNLVDPSQQITSGCDPTQGNTFTVAGRGGLPENPTSALLGRAIWWDNRDLSNSNLAAVVELEKAPKSESNPEIVEANGWIVNQKGQVELVANHNRNNSWRSHPNCPRLH